MGRTPIDPHIPLALWLMAVIEGYGSARELEALCTQHLRYRWICGGVSANYHSLSDFRSADPEFLSRLLTQTVASLLHQNLIELTEVAQDGMRTRAHAGASSFRREATLEECLKKAQAQVDALQTEDQEGAASASERQKKACERAKVERLQRVQKAIAERNQLQADREEQQRTKGTQFKPERVRALTNERIGPQPASGRGDARAERGIRRNAGPVRRKAKKEGQGGDKTSPRASERSPSGRTAQLGNR